MMRMRRTSWTLVWLVLVANICTWCLDVSFASSASGPDLEWAKTQEECAATRTNEFGSVETMSFRKFHSGRFPKTNQPQNFTNVIADESRNMVVIGTRDYILHVIHKQLHAVELHRAIPTNASSQQIQRCINNGIPEEECHNHNMVLLKSLCGIEPCYLECGTGAVQPVCHWRHFVTGEIIQKLLPTAAMVCPYTPRRSTAVLVGRDTVFAGTFSVLEEAMIYRSQPSPSLTSMQDTLWLDKPRFVASFEHGNYVYMVLQEIAQEVKSEARVFSRLVRVCKNDRGIHGVFRSFLKARVVCANGLGQEPDMFTFDLITSVYLANGSLFDQRKVEPVLYASFNLPPGAPKGSAVCAYRMADIEDLFETSPFYYNGQNNVWHERERDTVDGCSKTNTDRASLTYLYLRDQLNAQSIIMLERIGLTSISVLRIDQYDIFYLGTDSGELFKMTRFSTRPQGILRSVLPPRYKLLVIDRVKLANTSVTKLLPLPKKAKMLVMTSNDIQWFNVLPCYWLVKNCSSCVQARDPYCGWCVDPMIPNKGHCLHRVACQKRWQESTKPMKYFQTVETGDPQICGPVVHVLSLGKRDSVFVEEKTEVNLTLTVRHASDVQWKRGISDDLHAVRGGRFRTYYDAEQGKATLRISPAHANDKGWYTVKAGNNISDASGTIKLVVTSQARIDGQPQSASVRPGSSAVFDCHLRKRSGEGLTVTWFYCHDNGKEPYCSEANMQSLNIRGKILMAQDNSLVLLDAQRTNVGKYRCEVRNDNTNVQSNVARLDIIEIPRMLESSAEVVFPFSGTWENQTLQLHCATSCHDSTAHRLEWLFNGRPLNSSTPTLVTESLSKCSKSTLHLTPPIGTGAYSCSTPGANHQGQLHPSSSSLTTYHVSFDLGMAANRIRFVPMGTQSADAARMRNTVSCPAPEPLGSVRSHWAVVQDGGLITAEITTERDSSKPYSATKSGDLRIPNVNDLPRRTVLTCWFRPDDRYYVILERR